MTDQLQAPTRSGDGDGDREPRESSRSRVAAPRRARGARANARHASGRGEGFGRFVGVTTLGAIIPGVGLLVAGKRKAGAAILLVVAALLAFVGVVVLSGHAEKLGINTAVNPTALLYVALGFAAGGFIWCAVIIATALAARSRRFTTAQRTLGVALVTALCVGVAMPSAMAARYSLDARSAIDTVFGNDDTGTTLNQAAPQTQKADPWANIPRVNVLLVGSDAGSDRTGVRTDSLMVASIDTKTGNTVLFGLPRNLENVPFPASDPLSKVWPNGFNCGAVCLLNAIWQQGDLHKNLFKGIKNPGLKATEDAVGNVLGLTIDYHTVIDLHGFEQLVDAMGGVYVNVQTRLPIGGSHDANGNVLTQPYAYINPGKHKKLDGNQALWFSRSRFSSDDYSRMERQRCMVGALIDQSNPVKLLQKFPKLAAVAKNNITTNIPRKDLSAWVPLVQRIQKANITSLPFTSSVINTSDPDFAKIRQLVQKAITKSTKTTSTTGTKKKTGSASKSQNVSDVC